MADIDTRIISAARRHDGLITSFELEGLAVSRSARRTRVADGRLAVVHRSVFLLGGSALTWERRVRALHLASRGVVSGMAASAYLGFERIGPGAVEVSLPREGSGRTGPGLVHRVTVLDDVDVRLVDGMPVTSPERTLIDITPRLGPKQLKRALDDACRKGLVDLGRLTWRLSVLRRRGLPGVRRLDGLLTAPGTYPLLASWLEREAAAALEARGLPPGRWQVHLEGEGRDARVDLFFDDELLVVEFDGHGGHATRWERQDDAERMAALTVRGYCVVRFTYDDLIDRPEHVARVIHAHLVARRSLAPIP